MRGIGKQVEGICTRLQVQKERVLCAWVLHAKLTAPFCRLSYDSCQEENDIMLGTDCIIQQEEEQDCFSLLF